MASAIAAGALPFLIPLASTGSLTFAASEGERASGERGDGEDDLGAVTSAGQRKNSHKALETFGEDDEGPQEVPFAVMGDDMADQWFETKGSFEGKGKGKAKAKGKGRSKTKRKGTSDKKGTIPNARTISRSLDQHNTPFRSFSPGPRGHSHRSLGLLPLSKSEQRRVHELSS